MSEKLTLDDILNKEETIENIEDVFNDTIINLKEKVERAPLAISIGFDDKSYAGTHYPLKFGTFGNFSVITGEKKSRKSFVKSLIEACSIGGKSNNYTGDLEIRGHNLENKWIISIDCEQSKYDAWSNGIRIPKMVGDYYKYYKILFWREKSRKERLILLEWLFTESPYKDNLGLVVLDGFVDFVYDPNDQTECNIFIDLIMKYSSISNCHISGVLHVNPGGEKMRGHLGTIAGQRSETVMMVKNLGEYSNVKCADVRGGKPFKDFTVRIDDDWMPYVSDDTEDIIL
ncbi:MAG: hypothetical protein GY739_22085 [Mesoflavibacter sp.]|nr:hypothetical protein [Mesoflavibacter sp.]